MTDEDESMIMTRLTPDEKAAVNRPAVQELVTALRSGLYQQGMRRLMQFDNDGVIKYCCLGVACLVAQNRGVALEVLATISETSPSHVVQLMVRDAGGNTSGSLLPLAVRRYFGFTNDNPPLLTELEGRDQLVAAAIANDELDMDLRAIADAFERTYLSDEVSGD